jgi:hypothetical protein
MQRPSDPPTTVVPNDFREQARQPEIVVLALIAAGAPGRGDLFGRHRLPRSDERQYARLNYRSRSVGPVPASDLLARGFDLRLMAKTQPPRL